MCEYDHEKEAPWLVSNSLNVSAGAPVLKGSIDCNSPEDADFIAHAREDIPYLLAQLAQAREDIKTAYLAGYEKAHDDTVEGNYCPEQSVEDYLSHDH